MRRAIALVLILTGCGKPSGAPAPSAAPAGVSAELFGTGIVAGKVMFKGEAPKPVFLRIDADPYCVSTHTGKVASEEVSVNADGTLRNVFVYVKQGVSGTYPTPKEAATIDQNGCLYRPRVQGMQVGQPLVIRNSDDTLHNIHCLAEKNAAFNLGQQIGRAHV